MIITNQLIVHICRYFPRLTILVTSICCDINNKLWIYQPCFKIFYFTENEFGFEQWPWFCNCFQINMSTNVKNQTTLFCELRSILPNRYNDQFDLGLWNLKKEQLDRLVTINAKVIYVVWNQVSIAISTILIIFIHWKYRVILQ